MTRRWLMVGSRHVHDDDHVVPLDILLFPINSCAPNETAYPNIDNLRYCPVHDVYPNSPAIAETARPLLAREQLDWGSFHGEYPSRDTSWIVFVPFLAPTYSTKNTFSNALSGAFHGPHMHQGNIPNIYTGIFRVW